MARHTRAVVPAVALLLLLVLLAVCDARRFRSRPLRAGGRHSAALLASRQGNHPGSRQGNHPGSRPAASSACKAALRGNGSTPALGALKASNTVRFHLGSEEQNLLSSGRYIPRSAVPYDVTVDTARRGRLLVATPLARLGVPASLSTALAGQAIETDAVLTPYPSLQLHRTTEDSITDCATQIVSVISTAKTLYDDDTLYALDCGVLEITTNAKNVCPPKIITFDLRTDKIKNITVIENAACESQYTIIWVEECPAGLPVAYTSDSLAAVLTVTDLTTGASKHLTSPFMHPDPRFFYVEAGGPPFYMGDGVYGLSGDNSCDGKLYLQPFCGNMQGAVDKRVLRDASDGDILDDVKQVQLPGKLAGISGPLALDPSGELLFFPIQDEMALYCWNTSKPHHTSNFRLIAQDSKRLQFVSTMKIDPARQQLYFQTNKFTSYVWNVTNYSRKNYYVLYINITGLQC